jgi:sigma-B regulation protein RsbU (phosphoserine phosphatase)
VFTTGEARVVADLLDAELANGHLGTIALGIRHVLCVPLTLVHYVDRPGEGDQARRIGVLYLDGQDKGALLSPDTWSALGTLAAEAAQAIENARLYRDSLDKARLEQQMKVGAEIQQALFPKAGHSGEGFEVACASLPCLTIGGDFFDYLDLPDNRFGFVLGDVSGKGLPAALLTALLQGIFATEAGLGRSPADAMERANNTLMRKALQARYATAFYGILAPGGQLTYTNAGHNAPLLVRASGIERLKTGGTILGAFPDATFSQGSLSLSPSDLVVVFSDGVTEAFAGEWEEFGEERLIECVRSNATLAPRALLDQVLAAVRAFTGDSPQSDDQTVLVLRYTGT